jgi:hypothetical protein
LPRLDKLILCDLENQYPIFLIFDDSKDILWELIC